MNCYDCHPRAEAAVAVCRLCGKGVCREHCRRQERKVFEHTASGMAALVRVTGRVVPRMVCAECDTQIGTADAEGHIDIR
jgi:hypothetical protein